MNLLPAPDLRSNTGTWSVPTDRLPAVARHMLAALPPEQFDAEFCGQRLQTTYFDTADFDLHRARAKKGKYLTLRVRCYSQAQGVGHDYPGGVYALSAKTEAQKFRVEIPAYQAEDILVNGAARPVMDGLLPADVLARLGELADDRPLLPVVTVYFRRYAVEDDVHRLTLDVDVQTDLGKSLPFAVLEFKSNEFKLAPPALVAIGLKPIKISKFLWATER